MRRNQAEKRMTGRAKKPAKMVPALPTQGITPHVTGKPGEIGGRGPSPLTAWGNAVTDHLKDNPRRIKKGVAVRALHRNAAILTGH